MLGNLMAEMARSGVQANTIAQAIRKSERTVKDKVSGKYEFGIYEAFAIRDRFFPGMTLEYLFARDDRSA